MYSSLCHIIYIISIYVSHYIFLSIFFPTHFLAYLTYIYIYNSFTESFKHELYLESNHRFQRCFFKAFKIQTNSRASHKQTINNKRLRLHEAIILRISGISAVFPAR